MSSPMTSSQGEPYWVCIKIEQFDKEHDSPLKYGGDMLLSVAAN